MDDKKLPGIAAEDIGKCAYAIFKKERNLVGKRIGVAGELLAESQMTVSLTRALGKAVRYNSVTPEAYRKFGFPGAEDLGNMFQVKRDFQAEFCGPRDPAIARALNSELQNFDQWLAQNAARIPLE